MNKKSLFQLMTVLMVAMLSVGFTSCGDDDDEGSSGTNSVTSKIVGTWIGDGMVVSFSSNGTGAVTKSTNEHKFPIGSFKFGAPSDVETEKGQTWFFLNVTYTSGESSDRTIEWEMGYALDSNGNAEWLNIEGKKFVKK